jgi:methyltransferase-like protein 6
MTLTNNRRYDEAQLRFKKGSKLDDNFYVRQDGTCAYYFDISELEAMCEAGKGGAAGTQYLEMEEGEHILRQYANRQQKVARHRVWIQAKFVKGING